MGVVFQQPFTVSPCCFTCLIFLGIAEHCVIRPFSNISFPPLAQPAYLRVLLTLITTLRTCTLTLFSSINKSFKLAILPDGGGLLLIFHTTTVPNPINEGNFTGYNHCSSSCTLVLLAMHNGGASDHEAERIGVGVHN